MQRNKFNQLIELYQLITKIDFFSNQTNNIYSIQVDKQKSSNLDLIEKISLQFLSEQNYVTIWKKWFLNEVVEQINNQKFKNFTLPEQAQLQEIVRENQMNILNFKLTNSKIDFTPGFLLYLSPHKIQIQKHLDCLIGICNSYYQSRISVLTANKQIFQHQSQQKKWYIRTICSIKTIERQFKALQKFKFISLNLKNVILRPSNYVDTFIKKIKITCKLENQLKKAYNDTQYQAICSSLKQKGITLIHGPPGTGKTKTICGILSALLNPTSEFCEKHQQLSLEEKHQIIPKKSYGLNPWLDNCYKDWRDIQIVQEYPKVVSLTKIFSKSSETDRKFQIIREEKPIQMPNRILICGSSNSSVDEILRKLIQQELFDSNGQKYLPKFVRIGENYDLSLEKYCLDSLATSLGQKNSNIEMNQLRFKILNDYKIIVATLSACGSGIMGSSGIIFDTVIIDEAAQSTQISNLIPLMYGCIRLILIGDPNQLPATVYSQKCLNNSYSRSLFERLMILKYPITMLKTQYRMNPAISAVISKIFYQNQLINSSNLISNEPINLPSSFMMFHLQKSSENYLNKSYYNKLQAQCVELLAKNLDKNYHDIGIISPYSQQVSLLKSSEFLKKYQIKTADSFQGREKSVVIFSAVRSRFLGSDMNHNCKKTIGFVSDHRRLNVSLSRSKDVCIVIGDLKRLKISRIWRKLIENALINREIFEIHNEKDFFKKFRKNPALYRLQNL